MDAFYKKRFGTSGISGQLYETKLISLILFRLLHDVSVEHCYLASNMDEIGSFDDICLRVKLVGRAQPIVLFIQVKHRDNDDKFLTLDNKNDAVKWSDSILKIKKKIASNKSQDNLFKGDIGGIEYVFILYTNANCDFDSHLEFQSDYAHNLNSLIATSATTGSRALYTEKEVEDLSEKILNEDIVVLAERFTKFLGDKTNQTMNIMNDEYILRYHVILAKKVVNVSEIQHEENAPDVKWRYLTFQNDFFNTDDEYIKLFRNHLYDQILKNNMKISRQNSQTEKKLTPVSLISDPWIEKLVLLFLTTPSAATLSPLIEIHITCNKTGKLEFISERPVGDVKRLEQLNISKSIIDEAKKIAAKSKLLFLKIKVPIAFGNVDLAMSGNLKKRQRRLNHLTDIIVDLCQRSKQIESDYKIVTIDDKVDSGLLCIKGGLATAVGNILDYDKNTKLLKFTDDCAYLQENAKALFLKLNHKIEKIHKYRFNIKTMKFPKLSFDCTNISREFLNKLIIYAKQSNHYEVEEILKKEIQEYLATNSRNYSVKADSVFLYYHNVIQNWWMAQKTGPYLTKTSDVFEQAINNTIIEPQISALHNMFYLSNIKYFEYSFREEVLSLFKSLEILSSVTIITDVTTLTTIKVIQCLTKKHFNNKYTILDFECVSNLPTADFCALEAELRKTEKVVIIVFGNIQCSGVLHIRLNELALAVKEKQVIAISNKVDSHVLNKYFPCVNLLNDEAQDLTTFTRESQRDIINHAKVVFQGQEVSLNTLEDDASIAFIKGAVLDKILRNETLCVGVSLSNPTYEEIKHLYIERKVSQVCDEVYDQTDYNNIRFVKTFHDIEDDTVLITAAPGMGKSTLLTHLSLKTKERDSKLWIVRINLLDYSKQFYKWQKVGTPINTMEMLKFVCHVVLDNNDIIFNLRERNGKMYLDNCASDEWAAFELNMFLHFYNEKKLIFLFDGFDEICPHYKDNVIKFFEVVRNFPQKNKVWVTSRPYSDILPDLQRALGKSFKLEHLNEIDQSIYLKNIWRTKIDLEKLNEVQLQNVIIYMTYISNITSSTMYAPDALHFKFSRIFFIFYNYIRSHLSHIKVNSNFTFHNQYNVRYRQSKITMTPDAVFEELMAEDGTSDASTEVDTLLGTPLLLYLIAEYFVNVIELSKIDTTRQLGANILTIYEMFIESKLKKVLFQDKNKMDVYNPDIMTKFERERAECVNMHKKIAAYVLLGSPIFSGLNLEELKEMDPFNERGLVEFDEILYIIKTGAEKAGLISHVTADDIPVFIHRTFTEYFAAEFICDILKSKKYEFYKKRLLYTTTRICHMNDVFTWISKRKQIDKDLANIIMEMENKKPMLLTHYRVLFNCSNLPLEQYIRIMNSCAEDYEGGFLNKYDENYTYHVMYLLNGDAQEQEIKKIQSNIIAGMKPHLRKHFASTSKKSRKHWLRRAFSCRK